MIYLPVGPFAYSHRCLQQYPEHSISILWLVERKMIISLRSLDVPVMVTHVVSQIQIWVSKSSMPTYLGRERAWSDRVVHKRLNFGQDETRFPIRFAVIADLPFDRGGGSVPYCLIAMVNQDKYLIQCFNRSSIHWLVHGVSMAERVASTHQVEQKRSKKVENKPRAYAPYVVCVSLPIQPSYFWYWLDASLWSAMIYLPHQVVHNALQLSWQ